MKRKSKGFTKIVVHEGNDKIRTFIKGKNEPQLILFVLEKAPGINKVHGTLYWHCSIEGAGIIMHRIIQTVPETLSALMAETMYQVDKKMERKRK